jgi:serine/threonine protein phosphatase 1
MATVAIGDVHGNYAALEDLLAKITPELREDDTLVFLGDFIDRGHRTREVVERIARLRAESASSVVTLMGNHEDWMLKSLRNPRSHSWLLGMGALETIASYSPEVAGVLREGLEAAGLDLFEEKIPLPYHLFFDLLPPSHRALFESLQLFHRTPDVICVHGGLNLEGRIEQTNAKTFIWGPEGFPDEYGGEQAVVYGHHGNAVEDANGWPQPAVGKNRTYGIDSIERGVLTAISFPSAKIYQSARYRDF